LLQLDNKRRYIVAIPERISYFFYFSTVLTRFSFSKHDKTNGIIYERSKTSNYFPIIVIFSQLFCFSTLLNMFEILQVSEPVPLNKQIRILCWTFHFSGALLVHEFLGLVLFCPQMFGFNCGDRSVIIILF
jgi:hypothetical protein